MKKKFSFVRGKTILCFSFFVLLGGFSVASAAALPTAGTSFGTAVQLSPGSYQGGALSEWQELFYSVQLGAGQRISIEAKSFAESGCSMYLYNENEEEVNSAYDTNPKITWMTGAGNKYYLKIANDASAVSSFTLDVSLTNYYDANTQTDAGESFDRAMTVAPGTYSGYLAGNAYIISESGDDDVDMYKIALAKGNTYVFKLTPPSKTELTLSLYNANRQLIEEDSSANKGAIVTLSLTPSADTNVFVSASNIFYPYQDEIVNYQLEAKTSGALTKFYTCSGDYCEYLGEYVSMQACQTSTTKVCYASSNCNNSCGGGGGCAQNSDCPADTTCVNGQCVSGGGGEPTCQDDCSLSQTKCFDNFNYHACGNFDNDACLEWSTPVYCGEGNKCQNGKCAKATGCMCSAWTGSECSRGGCKETEIFQTRTCSPENCDKTEQCLSDSSCQAVPPGFNPFGFMSTLLGGLAIWGWFSGWYILLWLVLYVYFAICLQILAKKTNTPNGWLAWIPIGNIFLMISIAQKPLWWILLLLIPIVNIIMAIIIWMAIAERRGQPNWFGILTIVPFVGLFVPGYLALFDYKSGGEEGPTPPYTPTGTEAANKPTVGYKHACKYCGKLIPPDSTACPYCEKVNPLGPFRCPKCHEPIEKDFKMCPKCKLNLRIVCPFCEKTTFFGEHCEDCGTRLMVTCPNCGQEQPPISDKCIKCEKPLFPSKK